MGSIANLRNYPIGFNDMTVGSDMWELDMTHRLDYRATQPES